MGQGLQEGSDGEGEKKGLNGFHWIISPVEMNRLDEVPIAPSTEEFIYSVGNKSSRGSAYKSARTVGIEDVQEL